MHDHLVGWLRIRRPQRLSDQIVWLIEENERADVVERETHDYLVNRLSYDVAPHARKENFRSSANTRLPVRHGDLRLFRDWLSAEGKCSQDVHDQVHPE